jgi:hypothetical protein
MKTTKAPIEYVYDAISTEETQQIGFDILAPSGTMVIVLDPVYKKGKVKKTVIWVKSIQSLPQNREMFESLYGKLTDLVADGTIKACLPSLKLLSALCLVFPQANRHQTLPGGLEGIIKGLDLLENGQVSGTKLVALPSKD